MYFIILCLFYNGIWVIHLKCMFSNVMQFMLKSLFNDFVQDLIIPSSETAIHKLYKAIHQILLLRLNHTEIACLKTLILFRPGKYIEQPFQR